jgi:hypothetical protein
MNNPFKTKSLGKAHGLRWLFFLLFFAPPLLSHASVKLVSGYIISQRDDTVSTTLAVYVDAFGHLNESKLNHGVELPDSSGNLLNLTPDDIKGFGFSFKEKEYAFVSRPVDPEGHQMFVKPLICGPNTTLYCYTQLYYTRSEEHFTFEKQDGTYICISSFSEPEKIREALKSFFRENEETVTFLDNCFRKRSTIQKDVEGVVNEVNNEKQYLAKRK